MEPFVNKYPNGEMECFYESSSIKLYPDQKIIFCYWGEDGLPSFQFDLLSEVGEYWKAEIDLLIEAFEIELGYKDTEEEFCNIWISCNISPFKKL